jgi:hypothetical protein
MFYCTRWSAYRSMTFGQIKDSITASQSGSKSTEGASTQMQRRCSQSHQSSCMFCNSNVMEIVRFPCCKLFVVVRLLFGLLFGLLLLFAVLIHPLMMMMMMMMMLLLLLVNCYRCHYCRCLIGVHLCDYSVAASVFNYAILAFVLVPKFSTLGNLHYGAQQPPRSS